ncbi:hypothetical protein D1007_07997 [Hordeum vulgare]|nr:hypothetical protein D1007_07997 [Hordeum vulgare]
MNIDQMAYLINAIQGMEKNINGILLNEKSLERIVETKFHGLDIKGLVMPLLDPVSTYSLVTKLLAPTVLT